VAVPNATIRDSAAAARLRDWFIAVLPEPGDRRMAHPSGGELPRHGPAEKHICPRIAQVGLH